MSSSVSSRCCLPATSALVIAVRTIRNVDDLVWSRVFMAVVRSARSRFLSSLTGSFWQPWPPGFGRLPMWQPWTMPTATHPALRATLRTAAAVGAVGAATLAYSTLVEVRWFALRLADLAVLPPGREPSKVLHVSDLHMTPWQRRKQAWVRNLAALEPAMAVNSGDNLADMGSITTVLDAIVHLLDVPGVFVFGSSDCFAPSVRN